MRFGTIVRLFIALIIIATPIIITNIIDKDIVLREGLYGTYALYIALPLMFLWESMCTDKYCADCIMSGYCNKNEKFNNIKKILVFFGYNKDKLNNILQNSNNYSNSYLSIYKYIKLKYYESE